MPLTVSCFSKVQIGFTFLVLAHPGSPRKRAVKRVCVCVRVCACACACPCACVCARCQLRTSASVCWLCVGGYGGVGAGEVERVGETGRSGSAGRG